MLDMSQSGGTQKNNVNRFWDGYEVFKSMESDVE